MVAKGERDEGRCTEGHLRGHRAECMWQEDAYCTCDNPCIVDEPGGGRKSGGVPEPEKDSVSAAANPAAHKPWCLILDANDEDKKEFDTLILKLTRSGRLAGDGLIVWENRRSGLPTTTERIRELKAERDSMFQAVQEERKETHASMEIVERERARAERAEARVAELERTTLSAVLKKANENYHAPMDDKYDYPPFALTAWDDRVRWSEYLRKVEAREREARSS